MRSRAGAALLGAGTVVGLGYWAGFGPRTQLWGSFPYRRGDEKVVALTFDDGPNEPWTGRLLDVLAAKDVKATFFQVGRCAERFPSTTRRVVDEGHVLGNHSLNHAFAFTGHFQTLKAQIVAAMAGRLDGRAELHARAVFDVGILHGWKTANAEHSHVDRRRLIFEIEEISAIAGSSCRQLVRVERLDVADDS